MLLDARKMAGEAPEIVNLSELRLETRILVPSLTDLMLRFFSKPYAAQPLATRQARLFRVDGWLCSDGRVHSIELHTKGFDQLDSKADGVPLPVVEMATALVDHRAAEKARVASLTVVNADAVTGEAEDVNAHIVRLMTAGDAEDPYVPSSALDEAGARRGTGTGAASEVTDEPALSQRRHKLRAPERSARAGRSGRRDGNRGSRRSNRRGGARHADELSQPSDSDDLSSLGTSESGTGDDYDDDGGSDGDGDGGARGSRHGRGGHSDVGGASTYGDGHGQRSRHRERSAGGGGGGAAARGKADRREAELADSVRDSTKPSASRHRRTKQQPLGRAEPSSSRRAARSEASLDGAPRSGGRRTLRTLRVSSRT